METLKKQLLRGKTFDFTNSNEDFATVWFNEKSKNFVMEFNCKIIKATKTFTPIINKIEKHKLQTI